MIDTSGIPRPGGPEDPIRRFLPQTRLICGSFVMIPVMLFVVLYVSGNRLVPLNDPRMAAILGPFAAVAVGALLVSVWRHNRRSSHPKDPRTYMVETLVDFALAEVALLLGFVSSILFESLWPFALSLVPVLVVWSWVFPREGTWRRWEMAFVQQPPNQGGPTPDR